VIVLIGLGGFLVSAVQVYYAKFTRRGVVSSGFYKLVRHPQYLFLAVAGLGLLIVWPRFILLIIYINMLWFYYFLARSEEQRMRSRYGEGYCALVRDIPMFIPGEPGRHGAQMLFGWIRGRRLKFSVAYGVSLAAAVVGALALRQVSLGLTTHLIFSAERIAAVSFLPQNGSQLRELIELAESAPEVRKRFSQKDRWMLAQAAQGRASSVHAMIDAGMTRQQARSLPLVSAGIKLLFLERMDEFAEGPFGAGVRWQPTFIAEMDDGRVSRVLDFRETDFQGNPVMPIF